MCGLAQPQRELTRLTFPPFRTCTGLESVRKRAANISADLTHPGHKLFRHSISGRQYRTHFAETSRHRDSFFPKVVSDEHNEHLTARVVSYFDLKHKYAYLHSHNLPFFFCYSIKKMAVHAYRCTYFL
ncbi:hypothetical protein XENOCAPTIV_003370 [Xenoophorus captivus]|uniref:Uncharacterized protein n=1 Tax=Xenoophorus captivus TaxID=1517983 RepID=A0ABV0RQR4_9TELE